jgi:phosphopantothenoylcysteine decarboxylase/phosphopantothenate--cysteine ligase
VETTDQMLAAAKERFPSSDFFLSAAAVLDYETVSPSEHKLKKSGAPFRPEFRESPDILATLAKSKAPHQTVLGFAAETEDLEGNARTKLAAKQCDAVFANSTLALESETNSGVWVTADTVRVIASLPKSALADLLLSELETLHAQKRNPTSSQDAPGTQRLALEPQRPPRFRPDHGSPPPRPRETPL